MLPPEILLITHLIFIIRQLLPLHYSVDPAQHLYLLLLRHCEVFELTLIVTALPEILGILQQPIIQLCRVRLTVTMVKFTLDVCCVSSCQGITSFDTI